MRTGRGMETEMTVLRKGLAVTALPGIAVAGAGSAGAAEHEPRWPGIRDDRCGPHDGPGMAGLIAAGERPEVAAHLGQARAAGHRDKARERFERLFGAIGG